MTLPAQRTGFNTLDNWGHTTHTQSKRKRNRKERLKGQGPKHVYNTLGYRCLEFSVFHGNTTAGTAHSEDYDPLSRERAVPAVV